MSKDHGPFLLISVPDWSPKTSPTVLSACRTSGSAWQQTASKTAARFRRAECHFGDFAAAL